jgi:hypothetical protein
MRLVAALDRGSWERDRGCACPGGVFLNLFPNNDKKRLWPKWHTPLFALFQQKVQCFQCPPFQKAKRQLKFGLCSLSLQQLRRQTTPLSERVASESCILQKVQIHHEEATGQKFVPKAKKFLIPPRLALSRLNRGGSRFLPFFTDKW